MFPSTVSFIRNLTQPTKPLLCPGVDGGERLHKLPVSPPKEGREEEGNWKKKMRAIMRKRILSNFDQLCGLPNMSA